MATFRNKYTAIYNYITAVNILAIGKFVFTCFLAEC